jgi:hypothetical protein
MQSFRRSRKHFNSADVSAEAVKPSSGDRGYQSISSMMEIYASLSLQRRDFLAGSVVSRNMNSAHRAALKRMAAALRPLGIHIDQFGLVTLERTQPGVGWVSEQYCLETCLPEMVIRCESMRPPALFHHQKRHAVGETPVLVASGLVITRGSGIISTAKGTTSICVS